MILRRAGIRKFDERNRLPGTTVVKIRVVVVIRLVHTHKRVCCSDGIADEQANKQLTTESRLVLWQLTGRR